MERKGSQEGENRFEFDLNPYESFMRKHLQHYGYYTGRNAAYKNAFAAFADWDKNRGFDVSDSSEDSEEENNDNTGAAVYKKYREAHSGQHDMFEADPDNKTQEELLRTTQLVYSYQAGKMVPKLREPRQLFGFNPETGGIMQGARWPSEIQVLNERITHITTPPSQPEPIYVKTGMEKTPMSRSHEGQGRVVYEYEPVVGSFFLRSRVGGCRTGCQRVAVELSSEEDKTLIFESRFESGNLSKAVQVGEYEYELWLRNDLYTNKHTQWFYFRVSNTRANVPYRFTIVNLMKPDSLYNNGMKPLSHSDRDAKERKTGWVRTGSDIKYYKNNIRYTCGKSERNYYSLTWTCQFSHNKDSVYFAHCFPYTYTDMQDYLNDISADNVRSKLCKQRVLCRTLAGNLVYVLTITTPTKTPEEMKHRKAVVITSRVHPGESNSSWMMKGFLDYLLGKSADAKLLRDTFVFKIIPMLNPDGVIVGNYRCSLAGRDLNRNYKTVLKDSFPSVWHTKAMMRKILEEREIIVYCDLHGHSRRQNVFIYGCENKGNPQRRLRERIFPVMLGKNASDKFSYDSCKFKVQKSKEGTGRIVMWNMGIVNSFTMEATFCGSNLAKRKGYHFTTTDFEAMGYHFCDTLLDYCDPDNSKCNKILIELEEKMRQEILQHLRLREGQDSLPDISDINLDELSSEIESSDGGSDSSVSDGLPAHLQFIAQKFPKKKRLKTRKERDKHKCSSGKDDTNKLQTTPANTQETEKRKDKPKFLVTKRPKSQEERCTVATTTKDLPDDKTLKKPEGYLEALTNAYIRSGVLNTEQNREVPHFRYTAARGSVPVMLDGVCPQPDQAFAAQYVANHLQQFKYPGPHALKLMKNIQNRKASSASVIGSRPTPRRLPSLVTLFTYSPEPNMEPEMVLDLAPVSSTSCRTPIGARGSMLGGSVIPHIPLDETSTPRVLRYSKRPSDDKLRTLDRHLNVVQPSHALMMQLTPNQLQVVYTKARGCDTDPGMCQAYDLAELPKYKYSLRKSSSRLEGGVPGSSPAVLERRQSGKHILELSAAQQRQQDIQEQRNKKTKSPARPKTPSPRPESDLDLQPDPQDEEEISSPIKQHPPPFDEALERDKSYDFIKRGVSARSRQAGAATPMSRSRSARSVSALSRGWAESGGLDCNVILGPANDDPEADLWGKPTEERGGDSRQSSAASGSGRSAGRQPRGGSNQRKVPYVPSRDAHTRHTSMVPPATDEIYTTNKVKERITTNFNPTQIQQQQSQYQHLAQQQQHRQHSGSPSNSNMNNHTTTKPNQSHGQSSHPTMPQSHARDIHQGATSSPATHQVAANSSVTHQGGNSSSVTHQGGNSSSVTHQGASGSSTPSKKQNVAANIEITNTMKSINAIRESLLDPTQRANLSPTTGHFVEHFVAKTEAEISDITAELQEQLAQTGQAGQSLQELSTTQPCHNVDLEGSRSHSNRQSTNSNNTKPTIIPKKAIKESSRGPVVTTYDAKTKEDIYPEPGSSRTSKTKHNTETRASGKPYKDIKSATNIDSPKLRTDKLNGEVVTRNTNSNNAYAHHINHATDPDIVVPREHHNHTTDPDIVVPRVISSINIQPPDHHGNIYSHPSNRKLAHSSREDGYYGNGDQDADGSAPGGEGSRDLTQDGADDEGYDSKHDNGSQGRRLSSSPTKISLMMSRPPPATHPAVSGSQNNHFHAYPLGSRQRQALQRTTGKRR